MTGADGPMMAHGGDGRRVRGPVVAIDGPAGSGKSTLARALAERLGVDRLDTGAMYRAVTWAALEQGVDPTDGPSLAGIAGRIDIVVGDRVVTDGIDVTVAIRSPEVSRSVSTVAGHPEVRSILVDRQRRWLARREGGVVEGRDIGSVVLPEADVKVYLTASVEERARRRPEEGLTAVSSRDDVDRTRAASPLKIADGSKVIDTTGRKVEDIVEEVVQCL